MKKQLLLAFIASMCMAWGFAQGPWKFRSEEGLGVVSGESGSYAGAQTINGLYKKYWFLGLGAGLDGYRFRSVPLFAAVTRDLLRRGRSEWFLRLEGGTNLPWPGVLPSQNFNNPNGYAHYSTQFYGGPYGGGGVGWRFKWSAHSDRALLVSAEYCYKELKEAENEELAFGMNPVQVQYTTNRYDYRNHLLSLKIGWQF